MKSWILSLVKPFVLKELNANSSKLVPVVSRVLVKSEPFKSNPVLASNLSQAVTDALVAEIVTLINGL
jgi:hypothetical protein